MIRIHQGYIVGVTPAAPQLLGEFHAYGELSIMALTSLLERDYMNVYQNAEILEEAGLIERDSKNHIIAPCKALHCVAAGGIEQKNGAVIVQPHSFH